MYVHSEREISAGSPYTATMAIEDGSDGVTDVWVRITPRFNASIELYAFNDRSGITITHHASTLNATLLHVTVEESRLSSATGEESLVVAARDAILDILRTLNGIENGVWSEI